MSKFGNVVYCSKPVYRGIPGEDYVNISFATRSAAERCRAELEAGGVVVDGVVVGCNSPRGGLIKGSICAADFNTLVSVVEGMVGDGASGPPSSRDTERDSWRLSTEGHVARGTQRLLRRLLAGGNSSLSRQQLSAALNVAGNWDEADLDGLFTALGNGGNTVDVEDFVAWLVADSNDKDLLHLLAECFDELQLPAR